MKTQRTQTKSPLALAKKAFELAQAGLEPYSSLKSRHDFTQPQLLVILVLRLFFKTDYRGILQILRDWPALTELLGLSKLPHYSTLCDAQKRLDLEGFEHIQLAVFDHAHRQGRIGATPQGAMDSTGFESRHISHHTICHKSDHAEYAIRDWTKLTTLCETQSYL